MCRKTRFAFTEVEKAHMLSGETLRMQAGLTLKERSMMFEEKFGGKRLPITTLRKFYLANGVKRKRVRQQKVPPQSA